MELLKFTQQHEAYRDRLKLFLQKEVLPHIDAWEKCPIARTWRDSHVYSIWAGSNEIMKTIISRQILK